MTNHIPPFLLKEKVDPKVQADFNAAHFLSRRFPMLIRRGELELERTLSVEQQTRRHKFFQLGTLCRVGDPAPHFSPTQMNFLISTRQAKNAAPAESSIKARTFMF